MREIFNLHDIPYLTKYSYKTNENILREVIENELEENINENLELEKIIAEEELRFDEGIPFIQCIGDGAWSKRSYNYNYTANSAAGVLIGSIT